MKIGMTSVTFRKLTPEQIIEICSKAHIESIEWGGDVHCPAGDYENARYLRALSRNNNIEISSYGSYFKVTSEDFRKEFQIIAQTAVELECNVIRIWAGNKSYDKFTSDEKSEFIKRMQDISEIATQYNQVVCYEYHKGTLSDSPEHALEILTSVNKVNIKTYFQPIDDEETNCRAIEVLKDYIINAHVYNWENSLRLPLSYGERVWTKYIDKLQKCGTKNLILEFVKDDDPDIFISDAATLRKITAGFTNRA